MLRVAIIEGLPHIVVMRTEDVTVVAMPPLMHFDDGQEQTVALYHNWEGATFRSYYGVRFDNRAEEWRDAIPTLVCPCLTPEPLRLQPWPSCPVHHAGRKVLPIAAAVEQAVNNLVIEP